MISMIFYFSIALSLQLTLPTWSCVSKNSQLMTAAVYEEKEEKEDVEGDTKKKKKKKKQWY